MLQLQYNDYITAIILRKNSITGRLYRDDPNVGACVVTHNPACARSDCRVCLGALLHSMPVLSSGIVECCLSCACRTRQSPQRRMLIAVQVQILAWDIINEPANPGDTSGDVLFVSHCWLAAVQLPAKPVAQRPATCCI